MARYLLIARSLVVVFGCAAVGWGILEFPAFWRESSTEQIADQIIAGAPFKAEKLSQRASTTNSQRGAHCRPVALRSEGIVQLRMFEVTKNRILADEQMRSVKNIIRDSLSCSPADPFFWLVIFWMQDVLNGTDPAHLKYLRMSYQLGSNEGWIALKRNPIVLANLERLPPDLLEAGVVEFIGLVRSQFYNEASDILVELSRPTRSLLLARLKDVKDVDRRALSMLLYRRGLDDVPFPGVAPPVQHPWR